MSTEQKTLPSFIALLIEDVAMAREQLGSADSAAGRRNLVRTTLAAVEGLVWFLREEVRASAEIMGELTPLASMALRERSYYVAENGEIIEQVRFVTLPTMIRLICKQANNVVPDLEVRFDHAGWLRLKEAIAVRNRVTHPKGANDLIVTGADLSIIEAGFAWIAATVEYVLAATMVSQKQFLAHQRDLLERLKSGDAEALAAYQRAVAALPD